MEQALILTSIAFLGNKIIELIKYLRARDTNGAVTLLSIHITGVLVMLVAAEAEITETLVIPGMTQAIGTIDLLSVIFIGLVFSSLTSKLYDFQKAVDNSDSAVQPSLLSDSNVRHVVVEEHVR